MSEPEPPDAPPRGPSPAQRAAGAAAHALLTAVRGLPRDRALRVAGAFGRSWARLGGPRAAAAREHLRIAFPEWSEAERRAAAERSFAHLARSFVELATLASLSREEVRALADVEGLEHWHAYRERAPGVGAICLTGHIGSWELLVAVMTAHGVPIAVIQRPRDNPILDGVVAEMRGHNGAVMLPRGNAARAAFRGIRDGQVVAMTLDQNASRKEGVFVPFFGRPACTRDGPARIAMRTGVPVFPVYIARIGESARHRVRIHPELAMVPEGADPQAALVENVARMTASIEAAIREHPDQWIWTHRRWKTQPKL
ncbi:MAG TPA: lysophospholipid acyltransferase family protein [Myxococcota bacterium]|nr:lysophospholipid acyltransferase family protein [Myxococcota bacterium]